VPQVRRHRPDRRPLRLAITWGLLSRVQATLPESPITLVGWGMTGRSVFSEGIPNGSAYACYRDFSLSGLAWLPVVFSGLLLYALPRGTCRPSAASRHLLLSHAQAKSDSVGEIVWEVSVDSTITRSHQHAAGARRVPSREGRK
jgi:hypothetical protein